MLLRSGLAVAVHRLAGAALIRPLAWELPYAAGVALKSKKKKKKKRLFVKSIKKYKNVLIKEAN